MRQSRRTGFRFSCRCRRCCYRGHDTLGDDALVGSWCSCIIIMSSSSSISTCMPLFFCKQILSLITWLANNRSVLLPGYALHIKEYCCRLYLPSCKSSIRYSYFSNRVIRVWNNLPKDVDFTSYGAFKQ